MHNTESIIIDVACLEEGIAPLSHGSTKKVSLALRSLDKDSRRKFKRKFRKLLRKAIHKEASASGARGTVAYEKHSIFLHRASGMRSYKISSPQHSFRIYLVRRYLVGNLGLHI